MKLYQSEIKAGKNIRIFDEDEYPRFDCKIENLEKLKPVFDKDGITTTGNSSGINDGLLFLY